MRSVLPRSSLRRGPRFPLPIVPIALGFLLLAAFPIPGAAARSVAPSAHALATPTPALPTNASGEGWYHAIIHGPAPSARDAPAATFDSKDSYLLLFGGCAKPVCPLGDTWRYQGGVWVNLSANAGPGPAGRWGASMAYDSRDGYSVLFGGTTAIGAVADTWTFQYGRWTPVAATASGVPSPRTSAALIYDALDSEVILFGGANPSGAPLSDTWSFAGGVWTNLTVAVGPSPPARFSAGFTFDAIDREAVLFGGSGACGAYCADTWAFHSGRWTNLTAAVGTNIPTARSEAALAYDDSRATAVLIGGQNGGVLSDTWGFAHGAWMYLAANASSSLGARADLAAAFDPVDGYLVAYGGHTSVALKTGTWLLLTPLSAVVVPTTSTVVPGQAVRFTASVSGGFGVDNVTWNFGDGSPVVTGPSAGHTYFATGSFPVTATVTDGLGVTISSAVTLTVQLAPFTVVITSSPRAPVVGQTVTLLATVTGGTAPYQFQWSGDLATCSSATSPTLTCSSAVPRTLQVAVSVVDLGHRTAGAGASVAFVAASTGLAGSTPTTSVGASGSGLSAAFTSVYLTLAIFAACAVGVVTYRAGRRREAARRALRPLCYAVPAWSETPAEYADGARPGGDAPSPDTSDPSSSEP